MEKGCACLDGSTGVEAGVEVPFKFFPLINWHGAHSGGELSFS